MGLRHFLLLVAGQDNILLLYTIKIKGAEMNQTQERLRLRLLYQSRRR